jgi:hypothetical protein
LGEADGHLPMKAIYKYLILVTIRKQKADQWTLGRLVVLHNNYSNGKIKWSSFIASFYITVAYL